MKLKLKVRRRLRAGKNCKIHKAKGNTVIDCAENLEERVEALEKLLSGFGRQSLDVCVGGTVDTRDFLTATVGSSEEEE
jgi:hypothetical protein